MASAQALTKGAVARLLFLVSTTLCLADAAILPTSLCGAYTSTAGTDEDRTFHVATDEIAYWRSGFGRPSFFGSVFNVSTEGEGLCLFAKGYGCLIDCPWLTLYVSNRTIPVGTTANFTLSIGETDFRSCPGPQLIPSFSDQVSRINSVCSGAWETVTAHSVSIAVLVLSGLALLL